MEQAVTDKSTTDRQRLRRLWQNYIWPQKGKLFAAVFFMALLAITTAAYTWVISLIIDQAGKMDESENALDAAKGYAKIILPFLILIPFISGLANYFQRILTNAIALNTVGKLQKEMFVSAHNADFADFSREPTGKLISKFTNDVTVVSNATIRVMGNVIKDVLTVMFTIAAMLWQNWQLSLVMTVFLLAFWPIIVISKKMRGNARDVQNHIGVITSDLKESFTGARMVKAYGLEDVEQKRLGQRFDERIRLFLKLVTQQARVDPILEVLGGLAIAGVVVFGMYQVSADIASAGSIGAVLTGIAILSPRLRALGTLNNVMQEGLSAITRIFDVIDRQPTIQESPTAISLGKVKGEITFDHVSFAYEDGTQALRDISFRAKPGETIALVGASGGGKSTVINLIPRLYEVGHGSIHLDGHDIRKVSFHSLRKNMALVSQNVTLFDDTVAANIGLGDLSADKNAIIAAAKNADAHEFIAALPNGYETCLGEDGMSLSGGQRQRLSIARAILRDAPVLLLDEATSALDAESETKVQTALDHLAKGRTTIVIAHRLSTVQKADCIYVLDKGQIIERGTHQDLKQKKGGAYARLLALQIREASQ